MGYVWLGQSADRLGWIGLRKMDPWTTLRCVVLGDQPLVEERQRRERDEKSNDEEERGLVDENVQRVLAHRRPTHRGVRQHGPGRRRRGRREDGAEVR